MKFEFFQRYIIQNTNKHLEIFVIYWSSSTLLVCYEIFMNFLAGDVILKIQPITSCLDEIIYVLHSENNSSKTIKILNKHPPTSPHPNSHRSN